MPEVSERPEVGAARRAYEDALKRSGWETEMAIRIGANPIGWSNDDMQELGGDTPLETCLAEAREAGFVGMEMGHKFPRDGAALKAMLAPSAWLRRRLVFHGTARRVAAEEFEAAKSHLAMTKGAGAGVVILAETSNAIHGDRAMPLSQRPRLR